MAQYYISHEIFDKDVEEIAFIETDKEEAAVHDIARKLFGAKGRSDINAGVIEEKKGNDVIALCFVNPVNTLSKHGANDIQKRMDARQVALAEGILGRYDFNELIVTETGPVEREGNTVTIPLYLEGENDTRFAASLIVDFHPQSSLAIGSHVNDKDSGVELGSPAEEDTKLFAANVKRIGKLADKVNEPTP